MGHTSGPHSRLDFERRRNRPRPFPNAQVYIIMGPMSICNCTSYRGYRYYGLPDGTPWLAARV